jgi:DNA-binding HxlR family transcriptional regulator
MSSSNRKRAVVWFGFYTKTTFVSNLVALFHLRWAAPILAELHRGRGGRFVTLAYRLGLSRESLRRTLAALLDRGLVARNPGYGHPLRPEYVLRPEGARLAPACAELLDALRRRGLEDVGLKKWSLPVLYALAEGAERFSDLRAALPGVTPRALTLALKDLTAAALIDRTVTNGYPPASVYGVTRSGARLFPVLRRVEAALEEPPRRSRATPRSRAR